jgi:solute carrier family 13 (sodium-dependent dicarboxylate transporter), member 2/3/5
MNVHKADRRLIGFRSAVVLGLVCAAVAGLASLWSGLSPAAAWTAAVTALCALWWVSEPIPIPVTSLIPFAAFPLVGVLEHKEVATAYGHSLILLLLGGFILSTAMERSGAHRRVAYGLLRLVGTTDKRRVVLAFMLATAGCSMWISNTATTLMLLPVALAVLDEIDDETLNVPLLLGIAYAASIGGLGTPVGTPPNVIFMGVYREATGVEVGFLDWMKIGIPAVVLLLPVSWLWLTRSTRGPAKIQLAGLGAWRSPETRVLFVFSLTALAWVTRTAPFGGWDALAGGTLAGDATVALAAVVAMFLLPDGEGERLLDWETARKIPWGLLLLFGGGIAIARAFESSGLASALGGVLGELATFPLWLTLLGVCLAVTFLTEVTSNTASTTLLMPVLAAAATSAEMEPMLLMVPAALSASCAFMLPVATAPNAIVFGTNRVTLRRMAREGVFLNLFGAIVLSALCWALLG